MAQKTKEQIMAEMDNAAIDAENDLLEVDEGALVIIANWWNKW